VQDRYGLSSKVLPQNVAESSEDPQRENRWNLLCPGLFEGKVRSRTQLWLRSPESLGLGRGQRGCSPGSGRGFEQVPVKEQLLGYHLCP